MRELCGRCSGGEAVSTVPHALFIRELSWKVRCGKSWRHPQPARTAASEEPRQKEGCAHARFCVSVAGRFV